MTTIPDPQIYRDAAEVIRANGWHQGAYFRPVPFTPDADCPMCLLGAVLMVSMGVPQHLHDEGGDCDETCFPLVWLATFMTRAGYCDSNRLGIADWNDEPGRTEDEVRALLEAAAAAAESALAAQDGGESRG